MTTLNPRLRLRYDDQRVLDTYCSRLRYLVEYRLHPRLRGRISAAEVAADIEANLRRRARNHRCSQPWSLLRCLRAAAIEVLDRISAEYLPSSTPHDPYLLRLSTLPGAGVDHISNRLLGLRNGFRPETLLDVNGRQALSLQRAFNSLTLREREHLCLQHFERLRPAEAAVIRRMPLEASGNFYRQTMKKLRYRFCLQESASSRWFDYAHAG